MTYTIKFKDRTVELETLCNADLRYANLGGADLEGADLRYANLEDASLGGADLRDANLRYASLGGADLRDANLEGANLRDANLRYANLEDANLGGADLRDANLRYASLGGANISFSCLPLWYGGLKIKMDADQMALLAYHFCSMICNDPTAIEMQNELIPLANRSHAISEHKYPALSMKILEEE